MNDNFIKKIECTVDEAFMRKCTRESYAAGNEVSHIGFQQRGR